MNNNERVINALKEGAVPPTEIENICVGRKKEIEEFERILSNVKQGDSVTKFISGSYGMGKSFFLKYIEQMAYKKNFVVSNVVIGREIPFHKLDVVYSSIAKNLKCKTGIGLKHIVERWLDKLEKNAKRRFNTEEEIDNFVLDNILDTVEEVRVYSNNFATAISKYYELKKTDMEKANAVISWLSGDTHVLAQDKRGFGVKGKIEDNDVFDFLKALSLFLNRIGYSGLAIMFDEIEYIGNVTLKKSRTDAYDYIRKIVDNDELHYNLFLFAGTPEFFKDDVRGIASYDALKSRISSTRENSDYVNVRGPIINLSGFNRDDLKEITDKIQTYHNAAYKWDSNSYVDIVKDSIIDSLYDEESFSGGLKNPRDYIKQIVECLDIIQQNQNDFKNSYKVSNLFTNTLTSEDDDLDDW